MGKKGKTAAPQPATGRRQGSRWPGTGGAPPGQDGELTALVRRWMATSSQEADPPASPAKPLAVVPDPAAAEPPRRERAPGLPRRVTGQPGESARRIAVLIDARATPVTAATALLDMVADQGVVSVCRAYADWGRPDMADWVSSLRHRGLQSFHHFADGDEDRALLAMALDATDIVRESSVDTVAIAGNLGAALPLVARLHAGGVRVMAVGPAHTPHDVRAACEEFVDLDTLGSQPLTVVGRHRA